MTKKIKDYVIVYRHRNFGEPMKICEGNLVSINTKNRVIRLVLD